MNFKERKKEHSPTCLSATLPRVDSMCITRGGGGSTPVRFDVPVGMATRTCGRYATRLVQGAPPAVSSPYITARGHALKAAVTSCGDFVNYLFPVCFRKSLTF